MNQDMCGICWHPWDEAGHCECPDNAAPCPDCGGTGQRDSGGIMPWVEPAMVPCDHSFPAPSAESDYRWELGFRKIVAAIQGNKSNFTIDDVVTKVIHMAAQLGNLNAIAVIEFEAAENRLKQDNITPATPTTVKTNAENNTSHVDIERLIADCVPGGDWCEPQAVADAIRAWDGWRTLKETKR